MNETSRLWWIGGAVGALLLGWLLFPVARQALRPPLRQALVAIEPQAGAGAGVAVVGGVELAPEVPFLLRAVLVAGEGAAQVYFTEASRLVVAGAEVPANRLRRWVGPETVRVLWFTVEGYRPLVRLEAGQGVERFRFAEFFQPDWPREWTTVGLIEPHHDDHLSSRPGWQPRPFGMQRYQARIELYPDSKAQIPMARFASPGPADLPTQAASFPTVTVALPGTLALPSTVFGLSAIEPPPQVGAELATALEDLTRRRLAFWKVALFGEILAARGLRVEDLDWLAVALDGSAPWTEGEPGGPPSATVGGLLRVGARMVILYADSGTAPGRLDVGDLCIDLEEGTRVLPLAAVFSGDGLAELATSRAGAALPG